MKNKWIYISAAVLAVVLIVGGAIYYFSSGKSVASVAGEKVSEVEYKFFLNLVKSQLEATAGVTSENSKKFWEGKIGNENAADVAKNKALETVKEYKIQIIKAKQNNIVLDKNDMSNLNSAIDNMVKSSGGRVEADKKLQEVYGVNVDQYKSIYKDYMLIGKFKDAEEKKIQPSDDELKKYREEHKDDYDKVTVKHILMSTIDLETKAPLSDDKKQEAKKKAEDILAKAKAGEDFAALAKQYTEDTASKDKGGEYTFEKGSMVKEFESWSFNKDRKAGDLEIVETQFGYHVMKFEKRESPPFEDVKDKIKTAYMSEKYNDLLEQWKKDQQYNVVKNQKAFDSIKVI